jgi:hypothetical protein
MRAVLSILLLCASCAAVAAQAAAPENNARPGGACPPGTTQGAPTLGHKDEGKPLSDQLAQSRGVICPPAGVDPQIRQPPPEGGAMKVIPPPGSPGGNPNVQPK